MKNKCEQAHPTNPCPLARDEGRWPKKNKMQAYEDDSRLALDLRHCAKPVYQGRESTCLSIYGTSPENSSGTKLCFMRYSQIAKGGHSGPFVWATVCITDLDSGDVTELSEAEVTNHNGATTIWVDNRLLAFQKRYLNKFEVYDTQSGKLVHQGRGEIGHRCTRGVVPYTVCNRRFLYDPHAAVVADHDEGIFTLDPHTGEHTQIISLPEILKAIRDRHPDLSTYNGGILHIDPSPSGDRFLFDYRCEAVDGQRGGKYQGYVNADGTDCRILPVRCGHTLWFDNDSYYGPHDGITARYDLQGERIEVLGGVSCHTGITPDGMYYGGDRGGYRKSEDGKTRVYVFKRGQMEPVALIGEWDFWHVTWGWVAHANPAFSCDGKRFYFTRATGEDRFEACSFDMEVITSNKE